MRKASLPGISAEADVLFDKADVFRDMIKGMFCIHSNVTKTNIFPIQISIFLRENRVAVGILCLFLFRVTEQRHCERNNIARITLRYSHNTQRECLNSKLRTPSFRPPYLSP